MTMTDISILLISGPLAVGKTSVRETLVAHHGYLALQSSSFLRELASSCGIPSERASLQTLGDFLDTETQFSWVVKSVALPQIQENPERKFWVFDAVRKPEQVALFREQFGAAIRHVHLTCSEPVLKQRYELRGRHDDSVSYEVAINHPNEVASRSLSRIADQIFRMDDLTSEEVSKIIVGRR